MAIDRHTTLTAKLDWCREQRDVPAYERALDYGAADAHRDRGILIAEIERLRRYEKMYADAVAEYRGKIAAHEPRAAEAAELYRRGLQRIVDASRMVDNTELRRVARQTLKDVDQLGLAQPPGVRRAHRWDGDGERCVLCGDKDWMQTECQPDEEQLRAGLRRALDFYVANHSGLGALMEVVEAICGPRPSPTKCADEPAARPAASWDCLECGAQKHSASAKKCRSCGASRPAQGE
jgi:hypothetical protein